MDYKKVIFSFIGGLLVVSIWSLLSLTTTVAKQANLSNLHFGGPITFISQDQSRLDPPEFPYRAKLGSFQEYPGQIEWGYLILNVVLVSVVIGGGWYLMSVKKSN